MTNQKDKKTKRQKDKKIKRQTISNIKITSCKLQIAITRGCDQPQGSSNKQLQVCPSHFTHFSIDPNELSLYAQLLQIFDAFSDHGQTMETIWSKIIIMPTGKFLQFRSIFCRPARWVSGIFRNYFTMIQKIFKWWYRTSADCLQSVLT